MKSFVLPFVLVLGIAVPAAASVNSNADKGASPRLHHDQTGIASYYWQPQALASGGRFDPNAMTAAHKTLPFWHAPSRQALEQRSLGRCADQ